MPEGRVPIRTARDATPERVIVAGCLVYLRLARIEAWRVNVIGVPIPATARTRARYVHPAPKGTPDLQGVLAPEGRAFFVEVKRATGALTAAQWDRHQILRAQGALVLVVRSVDDLRAQLRAAGIAAP